MDIIALILFAIILALSVSLVYVQYQIHRMRSALRDAMKTCQDAVDSLRSGRG
jgi:type II secretory pathway pseudopilin PulG